jgi:hypothetical protein
VNAAGQRLIAPRPIKANDAIPFFAKMSDILSDSTTKVRKPDFLRKKSQQLAKEQRLPIAPPPSEKDIYRPIGCRLQPSAGGPWMWYRAIDQSAAWGVGIRRT